MEETFYLMKARTAWTFGHWFQDTHYWDDSLKNDGVPPSLVLIKEKDLQPEIESHNRFLESGIAALETSGCKNLDADNSGELPIQSSAVTMQDFNDGVASPSTSLFPQINNSSSTSLPGKQHVCSVCQKTFHAPSQLVRHLRTHSGDKPFQCTQCGKLFAQKNHLEQHLVIHTGDKPFSCTQCSYMCSQQSSLTKHLRTHTGEKPFTCDVCHKSFSARGSLKVHQRAHTNEKPHTCEHCGKCFSDKSNLTGHTRTHTGEKPYSCQTCGKSFTQSSSRNKHVRQCSSTTAMKVDSEPVSL